MVNNGFLRANTHSSPFLTIGFVVSVIIVVLLLASNTGSEVGLLVSPLMIPKHVAYARKLELTKSLNYIRYRFRDKHIIYGLLCRVTQMIYIGSTNTPQDRFGKHLVSGEGSN